MRKYEAEGEKLDVEDYWDECLIMNILISLNVINYNKRIKKTDPYEMKFSWFQINKLAIFFEFFSQIIIFCIYSLECLQ